jgi:spore maturation protein CgeB
MNDVFRKSQINLGHGGVGYSESITNVKGRDFDIPSVGGGVYLTTYNPDLAEHYQIGQEILCWHSYDDLLEQIRYYLSRPDLCRAIANRARERCLREHRWLHRYIRICSTLGILAETSQTDRQMTFENHKNTRG